MPDSANTPKFGYGQEWTNTEIDAGTAGLQSAFREFGHGTHVTGVGTGNGRAAGVNKGVAPKSDIIMVAYDFNYNGTETRIADAVHYLFVKRIQWVSRALLMPRLAITSDRMTDKTWKRN